MDVHRPVDAAFIHRIPHAQHLGAALRRRIVPFAVEVHAGKIGAQMAAPRAVGIHVGNDVEPALAPQRACMRSEEHTSELQSLMRISYAVFCLKKKKKKIITNKISSKTRHHHKEIL